jgi:Arc/MetJ-type ribon-helix-helix transcriptional regulator
MTHAARDTKKITVTLPNKLIQRLQKQVPVRQRSEFVAEALEEHLTLAEQVAALEESAGAWTEADHPELRTPEDVERWLSQVRGSWPERLAQLQSGG